MAKQIQEVAREKDIVITMFAKWPTSHAGLLW